MHFKINLIFVMLFNISDLSQFFCNFNFLLIRTFDVYLIIKSIKNILLLFLILLLLLFLFLFYLSSVVSISALEYL